MLLAPRPPVLSPCKDLQDLTLKLGGEWESLPDDCQDLPGSEAVGSQPSQSRLTLRMYARKILSPEFAPMAIRMALVLGSFAMAINHGEALLKNDMTRNRWASGVLSFVTPYLVSVYGQAQCQLRTSPSGTSRDREN